MIKTQRTDIWWVEPLWTGLGFLSFVVYTTWAMFQGNHYWWSAGQEGFCGYLSPFYSPLLFIKEGGGAAMLTGRKKVIYQCVIVGVIDGAYVEGERII